MRHYLINFTVYLLAMTGVIFLAIIIWKNATSVTQKMKKSGMKIEDSLNLSPRKTLYIINIQDERFLIASDYDKTVLLSKLQKDEKPSFEIMQEELMKEELEKDNSEDIQKEEIHVEEKKPKNVLQELMKGIG